MTRPGTYPRDPRGLEDRCERQEAEIRSLCSEILERYEEASLVYRLTAELGSVIGEIAMADLVLRNAARLLGARAGSIWLERAGSVESIASFPDATANAGPEDREPFTALYEGSPWVREAREGEESVVAVPLPNPEGDPIGVMILRGRNEGRSYRSGETKLLTALAAVTAAFIRNDRLGEAARVAEAKRREDDIARQVHQGLLPDAEPEFPGLDVSGICLSADTVGGDYYGYIPMADGGLGLAIADISGHGVGAAMYMAAAKGALQTEARRIIAPSDLLRRTNEALAHDFGRSNVFATVFFLRFLREGGRIEFANGGHNPPLVVRADGRVERLERGGLALGILQNVLYQEESRDFEPGDVLVVYTDGLIEARDEGRRFYGLDRLERLVASHRRESAQSLRDGIVEDLERHVGGRAFRDDVTLVIVRAVPADTGFEVRAHG